MRTVAALALGLWCLAAALCGQAPNVLVILADDLGVDSVACYQEGNDLPNTPNLDALAARGVLFRNAYAYPSCSPCRAAILTGRHPTRTLVGRWIRDENNTGPAVGTIRAQEWTIPELLDRAQSGYTHAAIGKWHMHDITFGAPAPRTLGGYSHYTGFLAGQLPSYYSWPRVANGASATSTTYATTQQTDDALAWIGAQPGPWFCYLAYNAPHLPMQAPPANLHTRNLGGNPSQRQLYLAMIEAMDTEIGRLFATLGPTVMANTHVIFLGDNGSIQNMAVAPFLGGRAKGTPYEGGINVPLICAGPAVTAPGREVPALACAVDVFATVLELTQSTAALPAWTATDGISLVAYLGNPQQTALRQFAWSEEFTGNAWPAPNQNGHAVVRNDRYKLISRSNGVRELFDLQADPFEAINLLGGTLTATQLSNYNALLGEIARMRTPAATATTFGSGCAGSAGTPTAAAASTPRLGTTAAVQLAGGPANTLAVLAYGFSHTKQGIVNLPRSLQPWGTNPGCTQWFSLESTLARVSDAGGAASSPLTIPNVPALVETTFFAGWYVFDPAAPANSLGMTTSNALALVVGS
ncbi:MAG: hypothetical protein RL398_3093 [Planctomycetota bacterium]|jgi:arylsulfatase A-like enzyme